MEQRTRNILMGGAALEFAILLKSAVVPPSSNEELHPFADEEAKRSTSFRRIWYLFTSLLGSSRLACALSQPAPSKPLWAFTVWLHLAELVFFYKEALDKKDLQPPHKAFLAILWVMPYTLIVKTPTM